jgi:hypothetical protein
MVPIMTSLIKVGATKLRVPSWEGEVITLKVFTVTIITRLRVPSWEGEVITLKVLRLPSLLDYVFLVGKARSSL